MENLIVDTGFSTVYEPRNWPPVVDIVIVHGLQGHPYKTWASLDSAKDGRTSLKKLLRRAIPSYRANKSSGSIPLKVDSMSSTATLSEQNMRKASDVFWPTDSLPKDCPRARVLVYGYDSKVTKYMAEAPNQNSVFSHGKDLLFALCRERPSHRPLVLIAHSLGGIVVKEMLARSSTSTDTSAMDVVESIAAIIFLGTPHRGSPELAAFGEFARSIASSLRMKTAPAILDALGLKTTDLERAQEAFSGLWQRYSFRVKTFQEGLGLTGVNLGALGNKVVPDYSSLIGDERERAETLQANHMDMCRFTGTNDPNYCKVAGELRSIYNTIISPHPATIPSVSGLKLSSTTDLSPSEKVCLQSLWFPSMNKRRQSIDKPTEHTCLWIFEHESYRGWFDGSHRARNHGLIWLLGKPGAGKSTLMKEIFLRASMGQDRSDYVTAAFFFDAKGDEFQRSSAGLLRSLLFQLLTKNQAYLREWSRRWERCEDEKLPWPEGELRRILQNMFTQSSAKKTLIFIDALDECEATVREEAYFWRRLTESAHDNQVDLNVCLSSRHFPTITVSRCSEISIEHYNIHDITTFVEQKFKLSIASKEPRWELVRDKITEKSAGVFLWVILVVDAVLRKWDEGNDLQQILTQLDDIPEALESLFVQLFDSLDTESSQFTRRFFHWVLLATQPLRVHEWHHIMAFIRDPSPWDLSELEVSSKLSERDNQLERKIRSISKGLVEVKTLNRSAGTQDGSLETLSVCAGAGSLDLEYGESRVVEVIHETVRKFFLDRMGFDLIFGPPQQSWLPWTGTAIGHGHLSIMDTCLDYIDVAELDPLVLARYERAKAEWSARSPQREKQGIRSRSPSPMSLITLRRDARVTEIESSSVFESLKALPEPRSHLDVSRWLETGLCAAGSETSDCSRADSISNLSDGPRTQLLEAYPALLSYITNVFFTHALLAESAGADPSPIINRLQHNGIWARWVMLREDLPLETELFSYAASQGLRHWRPPFYYPQEPPPTDTRVKPPPSGTCVGVKRRRSVASFSSASSHG